MDSTPGQELSVAGSGVAGGAPSAGLKSSVANEALAETLDRHTAAVKNENIEAVHKMRVASRRLRAVLDAYQSICNPKHSRKSIGV